MLKAYDRFNWDNEKKKPKRKFKLVGGESFPHQIQYNKTPSDVQFGRGAVQIFIETPRRPMLKCLEALSIRSPKTSRSPLDSKPDSKPEAPYEDSRDAPRCSMEAHVEDASKPLRNPLKNPTSDARSPY